VPAKPKKIQLETELPEEEVDKLFGTFLDDDSYDILVDGESADVYKPNGETLIKFRKGVLSAGACRSAYPAMRTAARESHNRGLASGVVESPDQVDGRTGVISRDGGGTRLRPLKKDGTISNTTYSRMAESGIIGHFDRNARFPYCRLTSFNLDHPERFQAAIPLFREIDRVFEEAMPDRHAAQMEYVRRTTPDFMIHGTSFTTVTVNRNWQTAVHQDKGDLKAGFGVMSALRAGNYQGCYLVFPRYRVAVNMCTRDVLLADVHCHHGNSPLIGIKGTYERISLVLYYRERMAECGSLDEELHRAKTRKRGSPLHGFIERDGGEE
jgi:hypothetical protein